MAISSDHTEDRDTTKEKGNSEQMAAQDQWQSQHKQYLQAHGEAEFWKHVTESLEAVAEEATVCGNTKEQYNMTRVLAGNNCKPERLVKDR